MKILIADTYYPEFLKSLPFDENSTYEVELRKVLDTQFGTADFYSKNLRALGWDAIDVIANHGQLDDLWRRQYGLPDDDLRNQISIVNPDVVFLQDLSLTDYVDESRFLAAQLSCPWPGDAKVRKCDVIFTSFPHYVPRIEALGVKAVYLPLAFEPSVLEGQQPDRDIDISFVGGVGRDLHWRTGTDVLEAVAAAFPERFQWFGYGLERLSSTSPLRGCYKGEAWGKAMYAIYRRSKLVVNRTGEVAEGFGQNMRQYEATGCGAMLLTDNRTDLFALADDTNAAPEGIRYDDARDAVGHIKYFLQPTATRYREEIASRGQRRTICYHTYAQRMKTVSEVLTGMLCPAA